jgi:lipoprotein-anchoring transpeptidase ErfK/SrfK
MRADRTDSAENPDSHRDLPRSLPRRLSRSRRALALAVGAVLVLGACGGGGGDDDDTAGGDDATTSTEGDGSSTTAENSELADYVSFIAQARGPSVEVFDEPGAAEPSHVLDNPNENGAPLVFLVEGQDHSGEWLPVNLPVRPNGSTGFVRASDVEVVSNEHRVKVELGAHRLTVTRGTETVLEAPVGLGTQDTPTPGGVYYIKELLRPPDPNGPYGVYAYGLSGFSNVLEEFNGGDGVIGIHGTNDPSSIGQNVSHGCIRLANDVITEMVDYLPLGTPVEIVA